MTHAHHILGNIWIHVAKPRGAIVRFVSSPTPRTWQGLGIVAPTSPSALWPRGCWVAAKGWKIWMFWVERDLQLCCTVVPCSTHVQKRLRQSMRWHDSWHLSDLGWWLQRPFSVHNPGRNLAVALFKVRSRHQVLPLKLAKYFMLGKTVLFWLNKWLNLSKISWRLDI